MPPNFVRARRRPSEQFTSTTEDTSFTVRIINGLQTENFLQHKVQVSNKNTDTHHFGCHGRTHSEKYGKFCCVIHLHLSTPLITTPQPLLSSILVLPSQKPLTAFQFSVLVPFSTLISLRPSAYPNSLSNQLPDCVHERCASRNRRCGWWEVRPFSSTWSATVSEHDIFSLKTSIQKQNDHCSIFRQHCCLHTGKPLVLRRKYGWRCQRAQLLWVLYRLLSASFCFQFLSCVLLNVCNANVMKFSCPQQSDIVSSYCSIHLCHPIRSYLVPNAPSVVPAPHMFPPRVVVRGIFNFNCSRSLPPLRASPLESMFQRIDNRIWLWITSPSLGSPHALSIRLSLGMAASYVSKSFLLSSPSLCSILPKSRPLSC